MQIRTPRDVGAVIRAQRRQRGLDQHALAQLVGVSRQWIIDIEKGKPRAEIGLVLRALDALSLSLEVGASPSRDEKSPAMAVDIDAVVTAARRKSIG